MGDLDKDTAVAGGDGRYTATPSADWAIWGPNGGYIASIALRAAMAESGFERPASLTCQYLRAAKFEEVELEVTSLRQTRRAECLRVSMTQQGERILEAQVWSVAELDGIEHQHAPPSDPNPPEATPTILEQFAIHGIEDPGQPPFPFWLNFESRPLDFIVDWENRPAGEPVAGGWYRYEPTATFPDDPVIDACRSLILADTFTWPAVTRAHTGQLPWIAPSLDLAVQFHHDVRDQPWLLVRGEAPIAHGGTIACTSRVWGADGRLAATGSGALLCIPAGSR
jgi:acyl-CoA thioesterase II